MRPYRVAVIILNYHGEHVLPACLDSLVKTLEPRDRILVVDNGGETEILEEMKEKFPRIETLRLPKNIGFAGGMNAGLRYFETGKSCDAYWLLNNDTIVAPTALASLKLAAQSNVEKSILSPLILSSPGGPVWFSGGKIDFFRMKTVHFQSFPGKNAFTSDFLTGCALFIPASIIRSLGLLAERYFLYAEDAEYSLRAKRCGIGRYIVPSAVVYHSEESEKSPTKLYWLVRSSAEFFLRESRGFWHFWVRGYYLLRRVKNRLRLIISNSPLAREVERAYTDVSL